MGNAIFYEIAQFDPVTWGVIALCSAIFGVILLRGNVLR